MEAARGTLSQNRRAQVSFTLRFKKNRDINLRAIVGSQIQTIVRVDPKTRLVTYE